MEWGSMHFCRGIRGVCRLIFNDVHRDFRLIGCVITDIAVYPFIPIASTFPKNPHCLVFQGVFLHSPSCLISSHGVF